MGIVERVEDHGLEVLKKSAVILDDSVPNKTIYNIRTLGTHAGTTLDLPVPEQYDSVAMTYNENKDIETVAWSYAGIILKTATLSYDGAFNLTGVVYA